MHNPEDKKQRAIKSKFNQTKNIIFPSQKIPQLLEVMGNDINDLMSKYLLCGNVSRKKNTPSEHDVDPPGVERGVLRAVGV